MGTDIVRLTELRDDTPITIPTRGGTIELSVATVLTWIAPDAPRGEALKFLMVCRAAGVNPFLGEADLVPMGDKWATVVGKTGLLRKAEEHGAFDGLEAGIICQAFDPKTQRPIGDVIEAAGSFLPDGFRLLGGWCRVYRKDRSRSTEARVSVREYARPGPMWQKSTCTMIRKVAIVQALRESGLVSGGWLDQSEVGEASAPVISAEVVEPPANLGPWYHRRLEEAIAESGMQPAQVAAMLGRRGAAEIADLSQRDAFGLVMKLESLIDTHRAGEILLPDPPAIQARGGEAAPAANAPTTIEAEVIEPPTTFRIRNFRAAGSVHELLEMAVAEAGMQPAQVAAMLGRRGAAEIADLSERDAIELTGKLESLIDTHRAGEILLPDPPATQARDSEAAALEAASNAQFPWEREPGTDDDVVSVTAGESRAAE